MNAGSNLRYLDAQGARTVLVSLGRVTPQAAEGVVGMLFPVNVNPMGENSWGVVITESQDGHVKDDDAAKMNYAQNHARHAARRAG